MRQPPYGRNLSMQVERLGRHLSSLNIPFQLGGKLALVIIIIMIDKQYVDRKHLRSLFISLQLCGKHQVFKYVQEEPDENVVALVAFV